MEHSLPITEELYKTDIYLSNLHSLFLEKTLHSRVTSQIAKL